MPANVTILKEGTQYAIFQMAKIRNLSDIFINFASWTIK